MADTLVGWHGTHGDFDAFDEEFFGTIPTNSPNGRLGVFVYTLEGLADSHGGNVLQVEASPSKVLDLTVKQMMREHHEAGNGDEALEWFTERRKDLKAEGYQAIRVIESDGSCAIAVIIDLECIRSVTKMNAPPTP